MGLRLSPIRVLNQQIVRSLYEIADLEHATTFNGDINFQFNSGELMRQETGEDNLEASLEVRNVVKEGEESGIRFDVLVRGIFSATYSEDGGSFGEYEMFMKVNAYSLLYAFVRNHIHMLSGMSPSGQVCLPCLDVASIREVLESSQDDGGE